MNIMYHYTSFTLLCLKVYSIILILLLCLCFRKGLRKIPYKTVYFINLTSSLTLPDAKYNKHMGFDLSHVAAKNK